MRLALLTALTMIAFAANSILTRMAVDGGHIDPSGFAILRVLSGAVVLCMVMTLRGGGLPVLRVRRLGGAFSLAAYMIGFSLAYLTLDAGLGALILFGVVQITMFVQGALKDRAPSRRQMGGAVVAFAGLVIALYPAPGNGADLAGALLMVMAGLGWAFYTILGRKARDPLAATTANFLLCLPILLVLLVGTGLQFSVTGAALAILSGGLTSGLGYALWYRVLPQLQQATAAIVQLSVPLIAILGGALLLGEPVTPLLMLSAALVIGGVAWAVTAGSAPAGHR
ncbi:MAG: DMT family transporter [Sulfitobacter sp.]|nr:DMT family transporter [Sulfitobacter sp.]